MSCNKSCNKPCDTQNRAQLLHEIMSLNFAVNDLVLYLDTHPNDKEVNPINIARLRFCGTPKSEAVSI